MAGTVPAQASGLFGSSEVRNDRLFAFKKWNGMLERYTLRDAAVDRKLPCRVGASFRCKSDEWDDFVVSLKDLSPREQIERVNSYTNASPYVNDIVNWRVRDYWETVDEFIARDGDCEDYAIAKYFALKSLGFNPSKMRIVVLEDQNLGVPHAVLVVYLGDEALILDNQIPDVVRDSSIVHYKPIYSINEQSWWFHKVPAIQAH